MTCNRDKNSMKEEAANGGVPLHVGLWAGKENTIACRALGGGEV